jgi:hypothetical protein
MVQRLRGDREPAHGETLFRSVRDQFHDYIHFSDERIFSLLATWTIGTYVYTVFSHYGYVFVYSAVPRSGKTRLLEIMSHLAFEATSPLNAPSAPAIRENAASGGTVLLDTLERWGERSPQGFSAAMEILDAGFRRNGVVPLMTRTAEGDRWTLEEIPVYAPYGLAGINRDSLADTALDRSFVLEMHRKPITIRKRRYYDIECEEVCLPIREHMYAWALNNSRTLWMEYRSERLAQDVHNLQLSDRASDVWRPILAVARVLGVNATVWGELTALAQTLSIDPQAAIDRQRLTVVRGLISLADGSHVHGQTTEMLARLDATGVSVSATLFHEVMGLAGAEQRSMRIGGIDGPRRVWSVDLGRLPSTSTGKNDARARSPSGSPTRESS